MTATSCATCWGWACVSIAGRLAFCLPCFAAARRTRQLAVRADAFALVSAGLPPHPDYAESPAK